MPNRRAVRATTAEQSSLGHRWWTVSELRATLDLVLPAGLAGLLRRLLVDDKPQGLVRLPWT
jgi:hypothetical protein